MKKIIGLIAIAAGLVAISANAQTPVYAYQSLTIPSLVNGGATSNLTTANVIGALKQQNVTIQINPGTVATNVQCYFSASVDGVNYITNAYTITTGANPTVQNVYSNFNVGGLGYLRLDRVINNGTPVMTNGAVVYGIKISSP